MRKSELFLLFILFGSFVLRIVNINSNPPELFTDELANITSAHSVMTAGKDLEGRSIFYFSDRVEMRPPLYGYASYFSSLILGENTLAFRLPAVMFGVVSVYLVYKLTYLLTNKTHNAVIAALALAVMPWHIHYSRIAWEPAAFLPFLLGGIYFLIKGLEEKQTKKIIIGFISFGVSVFSYHTAIIYSSILIFIILLTHIHSLKTLQKKQLITGLLIYIAFIVPFLYLSSQYPEMMDRSARISTFAKGINLESISIFIRNYFSHFSFKFLFIDGDPNLRHGAGVGVLTLWMLPFVIIGLLKIIKNYKFNKNIFLLSWLIIFPLAGSLTNDGFPHATRTLVGAPLFAILTGIGFKHFSKLVIKIIFVIIVVFSLASFCNIYFINYPKLSASWWQYGHKEVFKYVRSVENDYQTVCLGNLDYWGNKPLLYHYMKGSSLEVIDNTRDEKCLLPGTLVVEHADKPLPLNAVIKHVVYSLDNHSPIYVVYNIN